MLPLHFCWLCQCSSCKIWIWPLAYLWAVTKAISIYFFITLLWEEKRRSKLWTKWSCSLNHPLYLPYRQQLTFPRRQTKSVNLCPFFYDTHAVSPWINNVKYLSDFCIRFQDAEHSLYLRHLNQPLICPEHWTKQPITVRNDHQSERCNSPAVVRVQSVKYSNAHNHSDRLSV